MRRDCSSHRDWRSAKTRSSSNASMCDRVIVSSSSSPHCATLSMVLLRGCLFETLLTFLFVSLLIISILLFYFYQLLPDAVEALLDGCFGGASDVGDFAERMTVDVEEEEFAVVVVLEAVDETVEGLVAEVGGFVGEDVVDAFVVFHKEGHALSLAYFLTGDVEGDACDPGGGGALAPIFGP